MYLLYIYLLGINTIAFLLNGIDKWLAVRQKRRIPEKTLLAIALSGGTIGSGMGMLMFRHKISKTGYLLLFFGIMLLQGLFLFLFFRFNPGL